MSSIQEQREAEEKETVEILLEGVEGNTPPAKIWTLVFVALHITSFVCWGLGLRLWQANEVDWFRVRADAEQRLEGPINYWYERNVTAFAEETFARWRDDDSWFQVDAASGRRVPLPSCHWPVLSYARNRSDCNGAEKRTYQLEGEN
jgi:hypothetical protein